MLGTLHAFAFLENNMQAYSGSFTWEKKFEKVRSWSTTYQYYYYLCGVKEQEY